MRKLKIFEFWFIGFISNTVPGSNPSREKINLAQKGYFKADYFVNYLKYLLYFKWT
uniref:Candidate secreted effector n=1 Tax=Meloidogyne incognita TaxID=6306 RepID=A0A914M7D2_MELIC